ncbi:MAG TPA: CYTH domain-containing protein [Anaerovoracaceae bacterium]|nr:CYTH domain-containing protein [Anaerovoracaceae bacterium]
MEIEMKYVIKDKDTARSIWEDEYLLSMEEKDSREKVYMKAAYFDTDDYVLSRNDIAFRVRMEGSRIVASLKWNGASVKGLHTREEINVPIKDEACFIAPDPEIFKESDTGREMMDLVRGRTLHSLMETRFLRSRVRIDTGKSICEVAVDEGEIVTDFGTLPICELEIELFSGDKEDIRRIGETLAEKYHLTAENKSKYARGLKLLADAGYLK